MRTFPPACIWLLLVVLLLLSRGSPAGAQTAISPLHASGLNIVDGNNSIVRLRGVNLGGWLVMEPWMTPADSSGLADEYSIIQTLDTRFGTATEQSLIRTYRQHWITTQDLDHIKAQGLNVVRVPVWWGDFYTLDDFSKMRSDAFEMLDWLVGAASARGIYTIIDLHGVFGGQSTSDDTGHANQNQYWTNATDQTLTAQMWSLIAAHYNGNPGIAGYDLINEPSNAPSTQAVWTAYDSLYQTIRTVDPGHIIILEGTFGNWNWSMLPDPATHGWTNVVYQMHEYQWAGTTSAVEQGADNQVNDFHQHQSCNVPGYIGEFNAFGTGTSVWQYVVTDFNNAGLSWSPWSYKATHGGGNDSWGLYDPIGVWPATPNIKTDSAATIASDWSAWTTDAAFAINPMLASVISAALPPVISSGATAAAQVGSAFSYQITATNGPTSYSATGLRDGLVLDSATGAITGKPVTAGTVRLTITAANSGGSGSAGLTITVAGPPVITSPASAAGVVGTPFSYQIAARNNPASFGAQGLRDGLTLDPATGVISGTPVTAGTVGLVISAANASGSGSGRLAVTISGPPVITSATSAAAAVHAPFSYQIVARNGPTSYSAAGLRDGLKLDSATGIISGTPVTAGTVRLTLGAVNDFGAGKAVLSIGVTAGVAPGSYTD